MQDGRGPTNIGGGRHVGADVCYDGCTHRSAVARVVVLSPSKRQGQAQSGVSDNSGKACSSVCAPHHGLANGIPEAQRDLALQLPHVHERQHEPGRKVPLRERRRFKADVTVDSKTAKVTHAHTHSSSSRHNNSNSNSSSSSSSSSSNSRCCDAPERVNTPQSDRHRRSTNLEHAHPTTHHTRRVLCVGRLAPLPCPAAMAVAATAGREAAVRHTAVEATVGCEAGARERGGVSAVPVRFQPWQRWGRQFSPDT